MKKILKSFKKVFLNKEFEFNSFIVKNDISFMI